MNPAEQLVADLAEKLQRPVVPIERQLWDNVRARFMLMQAYTGA